LGVLKKQVFDQAPVFITGSLRRKLIVACFFDRP
jgi:hypothetical protein